MSWPRWTDGNWSRWHGDRERKGERVDVFAYWDWTALLLPRLSVEWCDDDEFYVSFDVGDDNSDPLASLTVTVRRPGPRLAALVERLAART